MNISRVFNSQSGEATEKLVSAGKSVRGRESRPSRAVSLRDQDEVRHPTKLWPPTTAGKRRECGRLPDRRL
jgi:hypothetical protein